MRIVIVGAGAMGSLFGCMLKKAGKEVWLLSDQAELAGYVQKNGIQVEGVSGNYWVEVPITTNINEIKWADLIIIFVKAYDTMKAISCVKPLVNQNTIVLTLQNGIGNVETIGETVRIGRTVAGTTAHGATMIDLGHISHAGTGETVIGGTIEGDSGRLEEIQNLFESSGIATHITSDISSLLWSKLLINVGINALTGIFGLKNGELLNFEEAKEIMQAAVNEAKNIVFRLGIPLIYEDPIVKVKSVCQATALNISSMLQDLRNGKKTEIDFINGAIVREGERIGIKTPINLMLTNLIHLLEKLP